MMGKRILYLIVCLPVVLLASCDVHQLPGLRETVAFRLKLSYETEMTEWEHLYDGSDVAGQGLGGTYDNALGSGAMRYVIRAYPVTDGQTSREYTREFTFTKDIAEGYDYETEIELETGDYSIMVWSDLMEKGGNEPFHNADDFSGIELHGDHHGNTDYRDAFRGTCSISLVASYDELPMETYGITMRRPMGKFEFITTDLEDFLLTETSRATKNGGTGTGLDDDPATKVDVADYQAVFYYSSYMPDTYNMFLDRPVDSATGVRFASTLKDLGDGEASVGFDYVFVDDDGTEVFVQIGIYDNEGTMLSLTGAIEVPLMESRHTIIRGKFLTAEASGGLYVNPDYNGEYNLFVP